MSATSDKMDDSRGRDPEGSYEPRPPPTQPTGHRNNSEASEVLTSASFRADESSSSALWGEGSSAIEEVQEQQEQQQQQEEYQSSSSALLSEEVAEDYDPRLQREQQDYQSDQDLALALALQEQLNTRQSHRTDSGRDLTSRRNDNEVSPASQPTTSTERAFEFTAKLVEAYEAQRTSFTNQGRNSSSSTSSNATGPLCAFLSLVNADDILFYTEHLLQHLQEAIGDKHVDVGYLIGYTDTSCGADVGEPDGSDRIRSRSLWTSGGPFGDGIYLANNPFVKSASTMTTTSYQVMLLARVKGAVVVAGESLVGGLCPYDSVIANKDTFGEVCVLGRPTQCIPLLILDSKVLGGNDDSVGNDMVFRFHCLFQEILDEYFNVGKGKTNVPRIVPSQLSQRSTPLASVPQQDPTPLSVSTLNCLVYYGAPESVESFERSVPTFLSIATHSKPTTLIINNHSSVDQSNEKRGRELKHCSSWINYISIIPSISGDATVPRISLAYFCGSTFDVSLAHGNNNESSSEVWSAMLANPMFLQRLQLRASEHAKKCPMCREATDAQEDSLTVGCMPTGSMRIDKRLDLRCDGFDVGAYVITYRFEAGVQRNYHENPGVAYGTTIKEAYIPSTKEGRDLLKRLVIAFACGMTFTVGTSISTGRPNQVTFSTISHKTSLAYGPFGYPDPDYFTVVNQDLDALGIPAAKQL